MEMTKAAVDVLAERSRQVEAEGWTPAHDDQQPNGHLALAGACYAFSVAYPDPEGDGRPPFGWPWAQEWWKPTDVRRDLVKAGALILAEIERLDRLTPNGQAHRPGIREGAKPEAANGVIADAMEDDGGSRAGTCDY